MSKKKQPIIARRAESIECSFRYWKDNACHDASLIAHLFGAIKPIVEGCDQATADKITDAFHRSTKYGIDCFEAIQPRDRI